MTRLLAFIVHNWPLKLAAVMLASLLYGIIVVAQDSRSFTNRVPITFVNLPESMALMSPLGDVTRVRYLAPAEVAVTTSTFQASVDLGAPGVRSGQQSLPVDLTAVDPRVRIVDYEPRRISVTLDEIISRTVPIRVETGEVPAGLDARPPQLDRETATVRGAASAVRRVDRVEAAVVIEPSGRNVDREIELVPVDVNGDQVREVNVTPSVAHVRIAVLNDAETRAVPVAPVVTGVPAPGFELAGISVDPLVVTLEGDGEEIGAMSSVPTAPISLDGATETFEREVELAPPTGILPVDSERVTVEIQIRPVTGTRSFAAGVRLDGARADRTYHLSTSQVQVVLGGSVADLDRLEGSMFDVEVPVAGLEVGEHDVAVTADLPAGLTLVSASPPRVRVTVGLPPATPGSSISPAVSPSS